MKVDRQETRASGFFVARPQQNVHCPLCGKLTVRLERLLWVGKCPIALLMESTCCVENVRKVKLPVSQTRREAFRNIASFQGLAMNQQFLVDSCEVSLVVLSHERRVPIARAFQAGSESDFDPRAPRLLPIRPATSRPPVAGHRLMREQVRLP